jgi:hypothetical protein
VGRTFTQLRHMVAREHPLPFLDLTSTGSGNSTTTITAVQLEQYADNDFIGAHLYIDGGTPQINSTTHREFEVTDSTASTGLLTFRGTLDAAPNSLAFEILPYSRLSILDALNTSIVRAYREGWITREFWYGVGVTGSPIYNPLFEYWPSTSAIDGWVASGTITRVQSTSTTYILPGESVVSLDAAGTVRLHEQYERFLADFHGHTFTLYAMLWSDSASSLRVQVLENDSVVASSSYHSGDSTWELISVERAVGDGISRLNIGLDGQSTGTEYAGLVWVEGGPPIREYPIPIDMMPDGPDSLYYDLTGLDTGSETMYARPRNPKPLGQWSFFRYQPEASSSEVGLIRFERAIPPAGRRLWAHARGPLTQPSADTDIVEVSEVDALLLAKMTSLHLLETDSARYSLSWQARLDRYRAQLVGDIARLSVRSGAGDADVVPLLPRW